MKITIKGLPYLILGALCYWIFWGNPEWANAIPFVAMLFFWPFYLFYKIVTFVAFWVGCLIGLGVLWLVGYLIYEKITRQRRIKAKLRKEGYIQ